MRQLTAHIVDGDSANHQLTITVWDDPGAGGACHRYVIDGFDSTRNPSMLGHEPEDEKIFRELMIVFQNGPIGDVGVNGATHEALLAILIDRLQAFQAGPFSCRENAIALTHFEEGLMWLQRRTRARIARGVEGTHSK